MHIKHISVELENCYGIKSLSQLFDFSTENSYVIYAPNGAMKTSFAKTFRDLSEGNESSDKIFNDRVTQRSIVDENGEEIPRDNVLVLSPYDDTIGITERTSTLLLDMRLKQEYELLHEDIELAKDALVRELKKISKTRKDVEKEISLAFTHEDDQFFKALASV